MVFKPNIRGYPRGGFKFGLRGWHIGGPSEGVLLYRFPFRKNWIRRLQTSSHLQVVMSRSGHAYLIQTQVQLKESQKSLNPLSPKGILVGSMVLAVMAIALLSLGGLSSGAEIRTNTAENGLIDDDVCDSLPANAYQLATQWISGKPKPGVAFEESNPMEIGGVRSSTILISCHQDEMRFLASWVKFDGDWQLKKMAQLEN